MHIAVNENGKVENLVIHYSGSGNPDDTHKIIGVSYWVGTIQHSIGDTGNITGIDKVVDK